MLRAAFVALLSLHGAIHLLGFAKAFGLAKLPQLTLPIARPAGLAWLLAALLLLTTAALFALRAERWWLVGGPAIVLSQFLIAASWADARWGTAANVIALLPLAVALWDLRPASPRSVWLRESAEALRPAAARAPIGEADLQRLPLQVQTWLRRAGVLGRPRPRAFRARFHGRMRGAPDAAWMPVRVEQVSTLDPPARLFWIEASRAGVPFAGLHRYAGPHATMQIDVLSLFRVVDGKGPQMDQGETVTLLNDLCLLAPASLVDAPIEWQAIDARTVGATYHNAGQTVRARLIFDAAGDLVDFVSGDRFLSADGKSFRSLPWSTPVASLRDFGGLRVFGAGDAVWHAPEGAWSYAWFEMDSLELDPPR